MTARGRALAVVPALLAALVVLLTGATTGAAEPAARAPEPSDSVTSALPAEEPAPDDPEPLRVTVDSLAPAAPEPGDMLVLTGRVAATEALRDVTVRLRVGRPLTSRSALGRADGRLLPTSTRAEPQPVTETLAAGDQAAFRIAVPAEQLRLESLGAHPLQVEVRARTSTEESEEEDGPGHDGETVSRTVQTFLPTFPDPVQPTRVAVLVPLVAVPPDPDDPVALTEDLAPGGRLHGLLEAGAAAATTGVPVTWVVDPALLEVVRSLAAAGTAGTTPTPTAPGTAPDPGPGDIATRWLALARSVLADGSVLALPYADPDVVALARAGLADELPLAVVAGRDLVADVLGIAPLTGWYWPPGGLLTQGALDAVLAVGSRHLVLDPDAVERADPPQVTPHAPVVLTDSRREVEAVTTDPTLTALLAAGAEGPEDRPPGAAPIGQALAVQRVAAETALLTAERPSANRAAVLAPPRLWEVEPSYVRQLLTGLPAQSWVRPVPLAELVDGAADPDAPVDPAETAPVTPAPEPAGAVDPETADPEPPGPEPDTAVLAEAGQLLALERALSPAWVAPVAAARRALDEFAPVLTDPEPVVTPRRLLLLRALGASWRDPEHALRGQELVGEAQASVAALVQSVRLEGGGPVLFTAESGTIPLTVVNELAQPVQVQVVVDAAGQARLLSSAVSAVEVGPGRRSQVDVQVAARTSGQFPVLVQLRTPEGAHLGPPVRVTVRSTAYGRVAMAITVGAAGVLVAAAGVRLLRRAWRTHRHGGAAGPAG